MPVDNPSVMFGIEEILAAALDGARQAPSCAACQQESEAWVRDYRPPEEGVEPLPLPALSGPMGATGASRCDACLKNVLAGMLRALGNCSTAPEFQRLVWDRWRAGGAPDVASAVLTSLVAMLEEP